MSDLLKSERQIKIEKSVKQSRSANTLDHALDMIMSNGLPVTKGDALLSYLNYQRAAEFTNEAAVTEMLASVYLKGAVDQLRSSSTQIKKSISSMQCTCKRVHPFTKSKIICPCGNELQGETEGN